MSTRTKGSSKIGQEAAKKAKLTGHGGSPEGPVGHWCQWVQRRKPALLSERLARCVFVLKNHGPDNVLLKAEHGEHFEVPLGAVRATYAQGIITVEAMGEESTLIEFDFRPLNFRY